jgi:chromosome segregation ATPase
MKNRTGLIVLAILCVGLGIGLIVSRKQSGEQHQQDVEHIDVLSNKWVKTSADLEEQKQVAAMLEKDLEGQKKSLLDLTNSYTQVSGNLAKTEGSLKQTKAELADREARITVLENQNKVLESQNQILDKQATDLSGAITNLTVQIAETQRKLSASEGDKAFLQGELKRLMAEKAELERQFNDLAVLKAQVAKLKEELNIARRIEWIRQGLFASSEQKGAQKLMQGASATTAAKPAKPAGYDLNVEVSSDGSVKVIPPIKAGATNTPAAK